MFYLEFNVRIFHLFLCNYNFLQYICTIKIINKSNVMKVYVNRTVLNAINNQTVQSVLIEKEEDGTAWSIVRHDTEELSMSYENLLILQNQIDSAIQQFNK